MNIFPANIIPARSHIITTLSLFLIATLLLGCGGPSYEVAPVSGKITFGDKPLPNIHVSFQPKSDGFEQSRPGPGSVGMTDAQGRYTLRTVMPEADGAVVGRHVVSLARNNINADPKNDLSVPRQFLLPEKCRDGSLSFSVPSGGSSEANFDLKPLVNTHYDGN